MGKAGMHDQWSSFEEIEAGWVSEPSVIPRKLGLDELAISAQAWGARDYSTYASKRHVADLAGHLKGTRRPLDAITVASVDGLWLVVDGYLRLMAYRQAGWKSKVPVKVFRGSAKEALRVTVTENSKARLPLTTEERTNAAWKMTRVGGYSKREVCQATAVAVGTVTTMRQALVKLGDAGLDPNDYPQWWAAKDALRTLSSFEFKPNNDDDSETWKMDKVEQYLEALGRNLPPDAIAKYPDLLAMALVRYAGRRGEELAILMAKEVGVDPSDTPAWHEADLEEDAEGDQE